MGAPYELPRLQDEAHAWRQKNFPTTYTPMHQVLGVCEESGELAHAILKLEQGIRGSAEEHLKAAKDACGDIIIFLTGVASAMDFSLQEAVDDAWTEVKYRDWIKNQHDGHVPVAEAGGVDIVQEPAPTIADVDPILKQLPVEGEHIERYADYNDPMR